jgi:hypothetical protein
VLICAEEMIRGRNDAALTFSQENVLQVFGFSVDNPYTKPACRQQFYNDASDLVRVNPSIFSSDLFRIANGKSCGDTEFDLRFWRTREVRTREQRAELH